MVAFQYHSVTVKMLRLLGNTAVDRISLAEQPTLRVCGL